MGYCLIVLKGQKVPELKGFNGRTAGKKSNNLVFPNISLSEGEKEDRWRGGDHRKNQRTVVGASFPWWRAGLDPSDG